MSGEADRWLDPVVEALGDPRAAPDLGWVAALAGVPVARVRAVLAELRAFVPFEREIRRTLKAGGSSQYAQIAGPFELYALVRLLRPVHVVEAGVSSGISSAHFLLALRQNGHGTLHSIDRPVWQRRFERSPEESPVCLPPGRTSGWAVPGALRAGWDLRIGPSERLLPGLVGELPRIGLFLHDDRHTPEHLAFELATVRRALGPGAVVLADNTRWTGHSLDRFATAMGVPVRVRAGTDLAGLRLPPAPPPAA